MKTIRCLLIITLIIFSILSFCNVSNASTLGDIISGSENFISVATEQKINESNLKDVSNTLYNVLLVLAIIVSVIVGICMGIKFVTAGAEGKADMKQAFVPYIIGNVVVFGAFGIWRIVVIVLNTIT